MRLGAVTKLDEITYEWKIEDLLSDAPHVNPNTVFDTNLEWRVGTSRCHIKEDGPIKESKSCYAVRCWVRRPGNSSRTEESVSAPSYHASYQVAMYRGAEVIDYTSVEDDFVSIKACFKPGKLITLDLPKSTLGCSNLYYTFRLEIFSVSATENASSQVDSRCCYTDASERTGPVLAAFKELLSDEDDCDVVLSVKGREFKAHQLILKARSTVFKKMFLHDMKEKRNGRVEIHDCDPDVFAVFRENLYTGRVDGVTEENVVPLYHVAEKYCVESLCSSCICFIKSNWSVGQFGDFAEIVWMNRENSDFVDSAVNFLAGNFTEISRSTKWKVFLQNNREGANDFFSKVYDYMKSEMYLCQSSLFP